MEPGRCFICDRPAEGVAVAKPNDTPYKLLDVKDCTFEVKPNDVKASRYCFQLREGGTVKESLLAVVDYVVAPRGGTPEKAPAHRLGGRRYSIGGSKGQFNWNIEHDPSSLKPDYHLSASYIRKRLSFVFAVQLVEHCRG